MISTPRAANTGRGLPAPNGASDATPAATPPVMLAERQVAVDAQPRHQIVGAERFVGDVVDRERAARGSAPASIVRPAACLWPPNRVSRCAQRSSAPSMSKREMLRHEPCAMSSSTDSTIAGR